MAKKKPIQKKEKKKKEEENELDPRIIEMGKRLEALRKEKGYTSYENFAIEQGISRMLYWRMEKGSNFTMTSLLRVLDAHDVSLEEFFEGME